jgi:dienelactone hydrolase
MNRLSAMLAALVTGMVVLQGLAQETGKPPADRRLGPPKVLDPKFDAAKQFVWTPPTSREAWDARRRQVREQVMVANGLWPMPDKTPLKPVIHGQIERDGYTIEKVFFASLPGHYVTGNLYRPRGKRGKLAGVLSPHGHWGNRSAPETNGRFYENSDKGVDNELSKGAEKTKEGARYPLQARCAQLARMGCVVFHYDMVGYGDSKKIYHPGTKMNPNGGFADAEAELRLQSFMGLQTWNSVRALDFLLSLPEVDPTRIGVTGASGGGTQTFLLGAVDDRPAAAFPAVMVSVDMQGGCICENCSLLRVGTGNIELAGLFAPRPLGMSGALDWTRQIESKGLPELQALYKLYGVPDNVMAKAYLQFGHNYNQMSRELMYNFFNKHLNLGLSGPVVEQPFVPVPPKELSVFDAKHPQPQDAADVPTLRSYMTRESDHRLATALPKDAKGLQEYRRVIGGALRAMVVDSLPPSSQVTEVAAAKKEDKGGIVSRQYVLSRKGEGEAIPAVGIQGKDFDGTIVVWVHPAGVSSLWDKDTLVPAAREIIHKKAGILAVDVFMTGASADAKPMPVNKGYAGYLFGYNRSLLANRVHDILTAVAFARAHPKAKAVHLVGFERAGPWVVLARGLCGDSVGRTAADLHQFRFENILSMQDEMMLPGALKYGGLPVLAGLCAPHELYVHNTSAAALEPVLPNVYAAASGTSKLEQHGDRVDAKEVLSWLLR